MTSLGIDDDKPIRRELTIAPPGCGKTDLLAKQITQALSADVPAERMLCITFTNQAADEMEDRVLKEMKKLGPNWKMPAITTLHAFCLRELSQGKDKIVLVDENHFREFANSKDLSSPKEVSLNQFNWDNQKSDRWTKEIPESFVVRKAFLIKEGKDMLLGAEKRWSKARKDKLNYYANRYLEYKKVLNDQAVGARYMDFNDILLEAEDVFYNHPEQEHSMFDHVFVDEVQDMTDLQLHIIDALVSPGGTIHYFGDPQQAIYSFMGAKVESLFNLARLCDKMVFHSTNYRSSAYLIESLNRYADEYLPKSAWSVFIRGWRQTPSAKMKRMPYPENGIAYLHAGDFFAEMTGIMSLIDAFPRTESTAVLARDNERVQRVIAYLKAQRKYLVMDESGDEHVYFLRLLSAHIHLCLNPDSEVAWSRMLPYVVRSEHRMDTLPLMQLMKDGGFTPLDLMEGTVNEEKVDREGIRIIAHKLRILYRPLFEKTCRDLNELKVYDVESLQRACFDRMGAWYTAFVNGGFLPPHQKKLWHAAKGCLQKMLKDDCIFKLDSNRDDNVDRLFNWLRSKMKTLSARKILSKANVKEPIVCVMTVHQAKGHSIDNVLMFEARKDVYHMSDSEEARIYFVGLTRARKRLILTLSEDHPGNPNDFTVTDLYDVKNPSAADLSPRGTNWEYMSEDELLFIQEFPSSFYPQ